MKICGIICEFNPFHNGHEYLLKRARELSGCDYLVCVMSGDFTQRGEIAVADKFTRARHAILGGADCIIELPAAFAIAPAEIFAKGAIKLLSAIPALNSICFGAETPDREKLLAAASFDESPEFKAALKHGLDGGLSYVLSYQRAYECCGGDAQTLLKPNNVLAVEYLKAIRSTGADIDFFPVGRLGGGYNDGELRSEFSSASAIRKNFGNPLVRANVPDYVFNDLTDFSDERAKFEFALKLSLSRTSCANLKRVFGCGEGLENALKNLQYEPLGNIVAQATSKRYSSSRIKRILLANFLGVYAEDCAEYLKNQLYFTPLAIKKSTCGNVLSALAQSEFPVITSSSDLLKLGGAARKCKNCDDFAHGQWCQITGKKPENKFLTI